MTFRFPAAATARLAYYGTNAYNAVNGNLN